MSKPLIPRTPDSTLGKVLRRLSAVERTLALWSTRRAIYTANLSADTNLTTSAWKDLCSVTVTLPVACRVRLSGQVFLFANGTAQPTCAVALFFGPAVNNSNAIVQSGGIDLQGSSGAAQPNSRVDVFVSKTLNLTPGTYTFNLAAQLGATGTAQALAARTGAGIGPDPTTFIEVVVD
jgi:hypothetical protein